MTGLLRDPRTVECDDETLAAIQASGGRVLVLDSHGAYTAGELQLDGTSIVVKLEAPIDVGAKRVVKLKPRLVLARGEAR